MNAGVCREAGRMLEIYPFLYELTGGQARPSHETLSVGFFKFDALPPFSLNRTNQRHLDEVLCHLRDQNRLATFD